VTKALAAAGDTANSYGAGRSEGRRAHPVPGGGVIGYETGAEQSGAATTPEGVQQMPGQDACTLSASGYQAASPASGSFAAVPPPPGSQPPATVSPEQARRAAWAAVAADQAYRACDFGRARQLISDAADLDPTRARLWDTCYREITAKQLLTQADAARQGGEHDRAGALVEQCRELDPRLEARWHQHLTGIRDGHITQHEPATAAEPAAGPGRSHLRPAREPAAGRAPDVGTGAHQPGHSAPSHQPAVTRPAADRQPQAAGHGDRLAPVTQPGPAARHQWQPAATAGGRQPDAHRQREQGAPEQAVHDPGLPAKAEHPEAEQEACG
jgi:hypothetical protein